MSEPSLPDKIITVHGALTEAGLAHAFGGALALAYYAEPRATVDIDLNLFVTADDYPGVTAVLEPLGVDATVGAAIVERDGQCRLRWGRTPIDLFFAYDPFHEAMDAAARTVPFARTTIRVLSPEHLIVCKAAFDRPKDWLDIEQILVACEQLDLAETKAWLGRIVGEFDQRSGRFTALAAQHLGDAAR
ncbi:MAG: hypothetical protein PGN13_05445 [Patulibacter minatonensis]